MALGNSWHYGWPLHERRRQKVVQKQHIQSVTNIYENEAKKVIEKHNSDTLMLFLEN